MTKAARFDATKEQTWLVIEEKRRAFLAKSDPRASRLPANANARAPKTIQEAEASPPEVV